jgi:hypothetical protein
LPRHARHPIRTPRCCCGGLTGKSLPDGRSSKRGMEDARPPICGERASFCQSGPRGRGSGPHQPATEWIGRGPAFMIQVRGQQQAGRVRIRHVELNCRVREESATRSAHSRRSAAPARDSHPCKRLPATVSTPELRIPCEGGGRRSHRRAAAPRGSDLRKSTACASRRAAVGGCCGPPTRGPSSPPAAKRKMRSICVKLWERLGGLLAEEGLTLPSF